MTTIPYNVVAKLLPKPGISPTYMQNNRSLKIADTVNIYVKLTGLKNL